MLYSAAMAAGIPPARKVSYALFAVLVALIYALKLGPVVLAGLFSYMLLNATDRRLALSLPRPVARWISLAIFSVTAVGAFWMFGTFVRLGVLRLPLILGAVLPHLDSLASNYGIDLPFENIQSARVAFLHALRENVPSVTKMGGLLTRDFFQIVIGIFIAVTKFLSQGINQLPPASLAGDLSSEMAVRLRLFMTSYEKVIGAQVVISLINTACTSLFLSISGIPYLHFLTLATFILGIIPLAGNVLSNTIIIGAALTVSPQKAVWAFFFLVLSHKAEYILNSRIVGSTIQTPMWLTLTGLLVGEIVLGVPGMILAPALLHYVRKELSGLPPLAR